jgi:hypothetical protein
MAPIRLRMAQLHPRRLLYRLAGSTECPFGFPRQLFYQGYSPQLCRLPCREDAYTLSNTWLAHGFLSSSPPTPGSQFPRGVHHGCGRGEKDLILTQASHSSHVTSNLETAKRFAILTSCCGPSWGRRPVGVTSQMSAWEELGAGPTPFVYSLAAGRPYRMAHRVLRRLDRDHRTTKYWRD